MNKLAVIFPGIGYSADKPLLHYSRRLAEKHGYEVIILPYSGFPRKVKGDRKKMEECFHIAVRQSRKMLSDVNFPEYDDILFIGKSIGTVAVRPSPLRARLREKSKMAMRRQIVAPHPPMRTTQLKNSFVRMKDAFCPAATASMLMSMPGAK